MGILNLTQHEATSEQRNAGVVEPKNKEVIRDLLTFDEIPSQYEMDERAEELAEIVKDHNFGVAMIGGAPFFMSSLENALENNDIKPIYAFSKRESIEVQNDDGTVSKRTVFKHIGFIE